jgi:hypothetical protein
MRQQLPHNRDVVGAKHDDIHCRCSMAGGCSASLGCTTALVQCTWLVQLRKATADEGCGQLKPNFRQPSPSQGHSSAQQPGGQRGAVPGVL